MGSSSEVVVRAALALPFLADGQVAVVERTDYVDGLLASGALDELDAEQAQAARDAAATPSGAAEPSGGAAVGGGGGEAAGGPGEAAATGSRRRGRASG